LFE
jgi:hypothetical protein